MGSNGKVIYSGKISMGMFEDDGEADFGKWKLGK